MNETEGAYVIVAGKTGGHIFPGIALAREIRASRPEAPVLFIGTAGGLESRLVPEAGFRLETVTASGFAGKSLPGKLLSLARLPAGFLEARALLSRHRARAVAGMGGYVSVPVLAAAHSLGIPTLVHDSNALPGIATRLLNRFAARTAVGLARSNVFLKRPGTVTGTPVRAEFFAIPPVQATARTRRLLVFGGSQGSEVLNRAMAGAARSLAGKGLEVVHQTGESHFASVQGRYGEVPAGWRLAPFLPRIYEDLAWSDLVVSRAGAMTLAELAAAGRPSILVPFGSATHGHQLENARALVEAGAARMIEESRLTGEILAAAVVDLIGDRERLVKMGEAARSLAVSDAAGRLAGLLFEAETGAQTA
ncbi:MAG TPA: undecaprenyldiphospho-muramoylpentapeptide beta-N-acetylglucosaminyltransferase [Thermoanaerobaculia bacterium]|nr:undecaprenyldiphospho-muramoylpentapeptide beta-N-acetylglucosaminyltransferase [Thermoanaerobaculia bacterium]